MANPVIILVRPQLGENIGKAARAMLNFGLSDLRLVAPRDGWPNPDAGPSAAGADDVLAGAQVFDSVEEAVADLNYVYATTVRPRDMQKPVAGPEKAMQHTHTLIEEGGRVGILFGPERSGLSNDDIALSDCILTIPVNPDFGSLNLAQAVILVAYDYSRMKVFPIPQADTPMPASKEDINGLLGQLEEELDAVGYFRPKTRRPVMLRMIKNLFQGPAYDAQQIRTLRGIVKALAKGKRRKPD